MDYKEFKKTEQNRTTFFEDYILKPFVYGAAFGVGYYLAVLVIQHPWSVSLLDFARSEATRKAAAKALKTAALQTQTQVTGQIQTVVSNALAQ